MPGQKQCEAGRIEFDQLAVQHARVRIDADLHRTRVDGVDFVEERAFGIPPGSGKDGGLAAGGVELVANFVVVHELPAHEEPDEADDGGQDEKANDADNNLQTTGH